MFGNFSAEPGQRRRGQYSIERDHEIAETQFFDVVIVMAKGTLLDIHIVLYPLNCVFFVNQINIFHKTRRYLLIHS